MNVSRYPLTTLSDPQTGAPMLVEGLRAEIAGRLIVEVCTLGATLLAVEVPDRTGQLKNICLRVPRLQDSMSPERNNYIGCVMGRFARCVRDGRFVLDGKTHQLTRNLGDHHFHGGARGFDKFNWHAEMRTSSDEAAFVLRLDRPAGDEGYPGAVQVETRYRIGRDGSLTIEHQVQTDAPTIVGMTSHSFWNLAGDEPIDDHQLALNASRFIDTDSSFIPLPGPPQSVTGTPFDLRVPQRLGGRPLDLCFALDDAGWAARLVSEASGRAMVLATNQPGIAVYSGDHLPLPRTGICLQTGDWPDAPNRPDFPTARLDPGQIYFHCTRYDFSVMA